MDKGCGFDVVGCQCANGVSLYLSSRRGCERMNLIFQIAIGIILGGVTLGVILVYFDVFVEIMKFIVLLIILFALLAGFYIFTQR
jgi:hypothetical protein